MRTKQRARPISPKFIDMLPNGLIHFTAPSQSKPNKLWNVAIFPMDIGKYALQAKQGKLNEETLNRDILRMLTAGMLKIWCECPAFHLWGGSFLTSRENAKLGQPERRPLIQRQDPRVVGPACKHMLAVLPELDDLVELIKTRLLEGYFDVNAITQRRNDTRDPKLPKYTDNPNASRIELY